MFKKDSDLRIFLNRFKNIKEELDEHLQSINENTEEIQASYESQNKIDKKIDKINEKIELLRLQVEALAKQTQQKDIVIRLTHKDQSRLAEFLKKGKEAEVTDFDEELSQPEQKLLLLLYSVRAKGRVLTYKQIAEELGMEEPLVAGYTTNLIEKGIPIVKHYRGKEVAIELERNFRYLDLEKHLQSVMD